MAAATEALASAASKPGWCGRSAATDRRNSSASMIFRSSYPREFPPPGTMLPWCEEGITGEHLNVSVGRLFLRQVQLELVQLLVIPRRRTLRAVELVRHRALRAEDQPIGFERSAHTVLELDERPHIVLVGDLALRVLRLAAVVMGGGIGGRQRAFLHKRLFRRYQS